MSSLLTVVQDGDESLMCCRKTREFYIYIVRPSPVPKWWRCKWVDIPEWLKPSSWSRGRRLPLPPSPASALGLGYLRISQRPNSLASTRPRRAQRPINRRSEDLSLLASPIPCLDVTFQHRNSTEDWVCVMDLRDFWAETLMHNSIKRCLSLNCIIIIKLRGEKSEGGC